MFVCTDIGNTNLKLSLFRGDESLMDKGPDQNIQQLFEAQAARAPDAVAVVCPSTDPGSGQEEQLTYRELNSRANQLAHYLRTLGVGPETLVGICVERSLEMVVGLLGILKAGGAYVPLDPTYPKERLAFMLEDAQVPVLLTQQRLAESLPRHKAHLVYLDTDGGVIAQESAEDPTSKVTADNLAYVIYTSGSTGRPKGVLGLHRGTINRFEWMWQTYPFEAEEVCCQKTFLSFVDSVWEIFGPLLQGIPTVVIPDEISKDPRRLVQALANYRVTRIVLVPSLLRTILDAYPDLRSRLSGLKYWVSSGEALTMDLLQRFRECLPESILLNLYGSSEVSADATWYDTSEDESLSCVPIGRPIANIQAHILDSNWHPVPVGEQGELYLGGVGLARGYLNQPDLTAERFIPDPFSDESGACLYRTGDLARYLPDGHIAFLGRADHQVKIRGFRIELGEIEAVLGQHPAVRQTVVLAREDVPGEKRLVAYVVPYQEQTLTISDLRSFSQAKLPDYMLPSALVLLEALPLTPNGKINRFALPAPDTTRPELEEAYVAPRRPVEEMLAGIWAEVLGLERIGVHDNFFELGGNSLLATQLVSRLRDAFQMDLPLRSLFEAPTVAGMARCIETGVVARSEALPIVPVLRGKDLPLSFAQQRLWFLEQLNPGSPVYNIPTAVRLTGPLDVEALTRSLGEIVRRHEALRTAFAMKDGQPVQVIAPTLNITLPVVDLQHLSEAEREAEAQRLTREEVRRTFDLAQGPLLRATLLRLDTEEHVLLLTMHHTVSDGWSMDVFFREMAVLYEAYAAGASSPLPELPIQYADFAVWQREWLQGEVLEAQLAYWKEQLGGELPALQLPAERPRPPVQTFRGATHSFVLSELLTEKLKTLSQREGVTLFMTLLAAFKVLLHRYTGQTDILVGAPIAGRNRSEMEGLIGFFVNTLVLRTDLTGNPTFRELLGRVREVALGAYTHQDIPFEKLVGELQPERDLSRQPLFQVMFALQETLVESLELPGLTMEPAEVESGTAKFDLTLFLEEKEEGLAGLIEYSTDLFEAATMARMAGHFQTLLEGLVADPGQRLSDLLLLTQAERHQLLVEWNDTQADYPRGMCVHQFFEAQVERTSQAVAAVYEGEVLTYEELNRRANQLAHYLRAQGVGPEVRVGICVERSLEMVIGMLGILKAGGAYVPLDPTYPLERLAFMLEDSQALVLLTQQRLVEKLPWHGVRAGPAVRQAHRPRSRRVICLDTEWPTIAQERAENPATGVKADNLAYVIYTSGSTGQPKGTMIPHRGLVNYLSWCTKAYAVVEGRGAPVHSSVGFDLTITGLFAPLLVGRSVTILPENPTGEALSVALRGEGDFSLVKITPAHLQALSQLLPAAEAAGRTRWFIIGGEAFWGEELAFWQAHAPSTRLVNEYGPTETVVGCCVYEVPAGTTVSGAVPIGRPIANTQLYVLDRYLQPVPVGVSGELYIGGDGVAWGYLNRPDLTAEQFVPDPFSSKPGARLYKTGDLARYRPDGNLEFLGRLDHQVKIRGYRIELGEVETVLGQYPAVRETVVMAREDIPGQKRLVAYVVPNPGQMFTISRLRSFLQAKLPDYMLPSALVLLEALPLTPNGKVDCRALPAPHTARPELEKAFVAPRTQTEALLANIWAELLGVKQVGIYDNFFELGGDSILSIQVIARANQAGLQLTPRQFFQYQTIAELAAVAGVTPIIHVQQGLVTGPVPLTPIQHWFFERSLPDPHHWNQAVLLEARQPLDAGWLEQVLQHLLRHHDAFRLRFVRQKAGWQQFNAGPDAAVPFSQVDLSALPAAAQCEAMATVAAELQASLNLSEGPLLRVALFDLGSQQSSRLLIVIHHLVVDGVSWRILAEDMQTAYQQLSRGEAIQLPPKTTSFKQWAERLTQYAQSGTFEPGLVYWLAGPWAQASPLPVDYPEGRNANTEASARTVSVSLSAEETLALLQEVPAAYRTQINEVLLTALAQAFAQWTGERMLLLDLEGHGREEIASKDTSPADLSRTVGWFTSIFPVCLGLEGISQPGEALKSVKEQLRCVPNRGIGYGVLRYLREESGVRPAETVRHKLRAMPQAELAFNYLGQFDQILSDSALFELAHESIGPDRSLRGQRRYLLEINGRILRGRLKLGWTYSENVHRRATIESLAQGFMEALRTLIVHCQSPEAGGYTPSDFPEAGLSQQELDELLAGLG